MSGVTSAVLPGHISEHTGRPSQSITTARTIAEGPAGAVLPERLPAGALEVQAGGGG